MLTSCQGSHTVCSCALPRPMYTLSMWSPALEVLDALVPRTPRNHLKSNEMDLGFGRIVASEIEVLKMLASESGMNRLTRIRTVVQSDNVTEP
jgi:hypothetical protein